MYRGCRQSLWSLRGIQGWKGHARFHEFQGSLRQAPSLGGPIWGKHAVNNTIAITFAGVFAITKTSMNSISYCHAVSH